MARRRTLWLTICFLGLVLLGTVIVLSTTSYYLAINENAYIDEQDFTPHPHHTPPKVHDHTRRPHYNASAPARIPRIIHQTWKSETLGRWATLAKGCRDMHPDYEYMLWTDAKSREFIAKEYPWFLDTFDDYKYPIQRADAIRYFVLHHYGGVYLDLDVGCLRPVDPLLTYSAILPKTIPVGVSNDLMFAEKGHPFMAQTIHNLVTFDHSWYLNYPTVMFSTGPMFLSAQYGIYTTAHPATPESPGGDVRILPKALYGKNARPGEAPHAFFEHYYGSSWHDDDAAFVGFLATWGKALMVVGTILTVCGAFRLSFPAHRSRRAVAVVFPRWSQRRGRWQLGLGDYTLSLGTTTHPSSPEMPASPTSSMMDDDDMFTLSLPMDGLRSSRAPSPAPSDRTDIIPSKTAVMEHPVVAAATDIGRRVAGLFGFRTASPRTRRRDGRVLFTVLAPSDEFRSRRTRSPPPTYSSLAPSLSRHDKSRSSEEAERGELDGLHPREGYVPSSRAVTPSGSPDPSRPGSPPRTPPQTHELDASYFGPAGRPPSRSPRYLAPS